MDFPLAFVFALQEYSDGSEAELAGVLIQCLCSLILAIPAYIGMWKIFVKAGEPGWAGIIPFYNYFVWLRIVGRPAWWILIIILVPLVNLVFLIIIGVDMAKSFGKGTAYGIGIALLGFIFLPILGFSDAEYLGPSAT
jgi:hypothetical protein